MVLLQPCFTGQCGGTPVGATRTSWYSSTIFSVYLYWIERSWAEATMVALSFFSPFDQVLKRLNFAV
jgi:hypothetical protein